MVIRAIFDIISIYFTWSFVVRKQKMFAQVVPLSLDEEEIGEDDEPEEKKGRAFGF